MASVIQCFVCGYPIVIPSSKPSTEAEKGMTRDAKFPCTRCHSTYELTIMLKYKPATIPEAALNLPSR